LPKKIKLFKPKSPEINRMSERKYKYHTVNLPESLAKKIEEVIESRNHGYTSIPDFVKSAVRRYLRDLGYLV
jgi:metal-responsive CopG/Arc/MetJ family transcriptional regulator